MKIKKGIFFLMMVVNVASCKASQDLASFETTNGNLKKDIAVLSILAKELGVAAERQAVWSMQERSPGKDFMVRVDDNQIQTITIRRTDLKNLKFLNQLSQNKLASLELDKNQIDSLEGVQRNFEVQSLVLTDNNLQSLKGLEAFSNLGYLYCDRNELQDLSGLEKHKSSLKIFQASSNKLKKIPSGILESVELVNLHLGSNSIQEIPDLKKLQNLEYLNLSYNDIANADQIASLSALTTLDLSKNQIRHLDFLKPLQKLVSVRVKQNPVKEYPDFLSDDVRFVADEEVLAKKSNIQMAKKTSNEGESLSKLHTNKLLQDPRVQFHDKFPESQGTLQGYQVKCVAYHSCEAKIESLQKTAFVNMALRASSGRVKIKLQEGRIQVYLRDPGSEKVYSFAVNSGEELTYFGVFQTTFDKVGFVIESLDAFAKGIELEVQALR